MKKSVVVCYLAMVSMFAMGVGFHFGIYTTFLRSYGLNEFEVNMVNVSYFVTLFLFEIPTGIFADVYGRKKSFLISCALLSLSMLMYSMSENFWQFSVSEMIGAIGSTFHSGAFRAWFVDSVKHHGYEGKFSNIFSWESTTRSISCMISAVIGGYLSDIAYQIPWLLGGIFYIITFIISSIIMKEEYFKHKYHSISETFTKMKETTIDSVTFARDNKIFRFVILIGSIQAFCIMTSNMQWQKIFIDKLNLNSYMGILMAVIQIFVIIGNQISRKNIFGFSDNEKKGMAISQFVIGIGMIITVLSQNFPTILTFFLLHELGRGMFNPIKEAYLQENIPSKDRATIGSFESMYIHIGGTLGLMFFGLIAKHFSIPTAWIISGLVLIFTSLYILKKNNN